MLSLTELVEIAKETESQISFDWSEIHLSRDEAYKLFGLSVQELPDDADTLKAALISLLVENMVLHIENLKISRENLNE